MSRLTNAIIAVGLAMAFLAAAVPRQAHACLIGCVKADIAGLGDMADALKKWAELLPRLNEEFHSEIRRDILAMDAVAVNLINRLDRVYGENLDRTSAEVRFLMRDAVRQIDEIGGIAVARYRELLWETECTVDALGRRIATSIEEIIPRFKWIRETVFGESFNRLQTVGFDGQVIEIEFLPESDAAKWKAQYELLQLRLGTATESTRMNDLMSVATDLQITGFKNHCVTRAAIGQHQYGEFYELWIESRASYSDYLYLYNASIEP